MKQKNKGGGPAKLREIKSPRQLIAVKKLSEIVRNSKGKKITLGKVLRESGYSESFSEHPGRAIKSKSFQELLEEHLPDNLITEAHEGALRASKLDHYVFPRSEKDQEIKEVIESVAGCKLVKIRKALQWKRAYYLIQDNQSRLKAIAEAYKIKNKYPPQKVDLTSKGKQVVAFNYLPPAKPDGTINPDNQTRT